MQCKDIPDRPILEFLLVETQSYNWPRFAHHGDVVPATHWDGRGTIPSVSDAMPRDTPTKLKLAKMGRLIKRGLVSGCTCGCRGDFLITAKGKDWLTGDVTSEYE